MKTSYFAPSLSKAALAAWACLSLAILVGCGQSHREASPPEGAPPADSSHDADDDSPDADSSHDADGGSPDPQTSGIPCGSNVCGEGEECCNASCGICVPKGGMCTQQYCE